jgi:hypothetical protein
MGKGKMMRCLRRSNGRSNANHDSPSNVLRSAITESSTTEYSPHHCVGTRTMLDKIHCIHQSYLPYIRHLNTTFLGIHARLKTVLHHFPYRYTNNPLPLFKHRRGRSAALSPSYFPSPLPLPFPFSPSPSPPPTLSITHTPSPLLSLIMLSVQFFLFSGDSISRMCFRTSASEMPCAKKWWS